jgi:hypothetical protein
VVKVCISRRLAAIAMNRLIRLVRAKPRTRNRPRVRFCAASFLTLPKMPLIPSRRLMVSYQSADPCGSGCQNGSSVICTRDFSCPQIFGLARGVNSVGSVVGRFRPT